MSRFYYLQDTRTTVGNCISFWALDHKGYTCDLDKAHVFDEEEILGYIGPGNRTTDVAWPKEVIDSLAYRHMDHQRLPDREQIKDEIP